MNFNDYVKKYQSWKVQEKKLPAKIDKSELAELRESWSKKVAEYQGKKKLTEALSNFREYKSSKTGDSSISYGEYKKIKERVQAEILEGRSQTKLNESVAPKAGSFDVLVENYRKFKEAKGQGDKITYKEVKALREAFKQAKGRLREADAGFDPTAGMAAPGAVPGAAPGMDPLAAGGTTVDPTIAAQIQDVKASVDALATAAGIQTSDFGADPNAATPPVDGMGADGMGAADPNAGAQPMMESRIKDFTEYVKLKENREPTKEELDRLIEEVSVEDFTEKVKLQEKREPTEAEINELRAAIKEARKPKSKVDLLRERILAREQKLKEGNAAQELGKKVLSNIGGPQAKASFEPDKTGAPGSNSDVAANPELVTVPGAAKLAAGYASGAAEKPAKTWPTKAVSGKGVTAPLQGAGATQQGGPGKIKEETEEKPDNPLQESVQDITEIYVKRELETPKLSFDRLKEALKTGMLG